MLRLREQGDVKGDKPLGVRLHDLQLRFRTEGEEGEGGDREGKFGSADHVMFRNNDTEQSERTIKTDKYNTYEQVPHLPPARRHAVRRGLPAHGVRTFRAAVLHAGTLGAVLHRISGRKGVSGIFFSCNNFDNDYQKKPLQQQ